MAWQDIEYVESIQADVKWMGFDYGEVTAGLVRIGNGRPHPKP